MLVLTRKLGQTVVIADGMIRVKVMRVDGDKVRLAIEAPDDVRIDREEVHERRNGNGNHEPSNSRFQATDFTDCKSRP